MNILLCWKPVPADFRKAPQKFADNQPFFTGKLEFFQIHKTIAGRHFQDCLSIGNKSAAWHGMIFSYTLCPENLYRDYSVFSR